MTTDTHSSRFRRHVHPGHAAFREELADRDALSNGLVLAGMLVRWSGMDAPQNMDISWDAARCRVVVELDEAMMLRFAASTGRRSRWVVRDRRHVREVDVESSLVLRCAGGVREGA